MDNRNDTVLKQLTARFLLIGLFVAAVPAQGGDSFGERLRNLFQGEAQSSAGEEFLPADEAFRFSASVVGPDRVDLMWRIADGYYLYRDKFRFRIIQGDAGIDTASIDIPHGTVKSDEVFGDVEVNTGEVTVTVPIHRCHGRSDEAIVLQVGYQGCKEDAICYPPVSRDVPMILTGGTGE
ncbi:MAG: protein-disulfide reductase DsbD domain-containing protein [Gammaproteobacteria bacterium]